MHTQTHSQLAHPGSGCLSDRPYQVVHLVRHSVHRIVRKVRPGLVAGGGSAAALPPADVHGVQVLGRLRHPRIGSNGNRWGIVVYGGTASPVCCRCAVTHAYGRSTPVDFRSGFIWGIFEASGEHYCQ